MAKNKEKASKPKNKGRFSKVIVFTVIAAGFWFANKTLNVYEVTGSEPSTLITAFYAFIGIELLSLAKLKKDERKKIENSTEEDYYKGDH